MYKSPKCVCGLGRQNEIISVDDLHAYELLLVGPEQVELQTYAERHLEKLLHYEKANSIELLKTLYIFLTHECNLQLTSEAMNLSLTGLKYRLKRKSEEDLI